MTKRKIRPAANGTDHPPSNTSPTPSDDQKLCTQCGFLRPLDEMAPDRRAKDGVRSICREHRGVYDRARYQTKREAILAQQRRYRQGNPGVRWFKDYKRRARKYGLVPVGVLLTREEITARWGDYCFYCPDGTFDQPDHFVAVAAGGHHTIENVVPSCAICNSKKRWEVDEPEIQLFRAAQAARAESAFSQDGRRS